MNIDEPVILKNTKTFEKFDGTNTDIILQIENSQIFSLPLAYIRVKDKKSYFPFISLILHFNLGTFIKYEIENLAEVCDEWTAPNIVKTT